MSFAQYSASASAGVTVGYSTQISLDPSSTTPLPTLTTIFTPPAECNTPLALTDYCSNAFECDGSYIPVLNIPISGDSSYSPIQCLPQTTALDDGIDGVYDYNPGLFCPDGMTTDTSIGSAFLCCPSGLSYSYDGVIEACTGIMTKGTALEGYYFTEVGVIVESTITWSAADNMTLYVAARPVYLYQESNIVNPNTIGTLPTPTSSSKGESGVTSSKTALASLKCPRSGKCETTAPELNTPAGSSGLSTGAKVGAGIGAVAGFVLLALGAILLLRYRRRRLTRHHALGSPSTQPEIEQQKYHKKHLPELPVIESRVELEGTQVEDRGPGIYVWKPELEGTAGSPNSEGVYVRKKSELEARYDGALFPGSPMLTPGSGSTSGRTSTAAATESPVVGPSFTIYS
ncbi:hypothetical protein F4678DRAFT_320806 [Xylaria arbuscula]|nr:hypothetical protein F4678DRAFT_320806 [Xylaria arbuscula]